MALTLICSGDELILTIIFLTIAFSLLIASILMVAEFIRFMYGSPKITTDNEEPTDEKPQKIIIHFGLIFSVLAITTIIIDITETFAICSRNAYYMEIFFDLATQIYICQLATIAMLWFIRIHYVFHDSVFRISKIVTFIYVSMAIIVMTSASIATWLPMDLETQEIIWLICYGFYFLVLYTINHIFVYKLYSVYKAAREKEAAQDINAQYFIIIITKIMILNFVSVVVTIIAAVSIAFYDITTELDFFHTFSFLLDNFTNIICVILSYSYYSSYYDKICGGWHRCCILCGSKIIGHNQQVVELEAYMH